MHHVAILHDVFLAFEAEPAFGLGVGFRARLQKLVPVDDFRADEMLLQVRMDDPGGILRARVALGRPGTTFVLTYGEE